MPDLFETRPIIYTAQSRHLFYARMLITAYAIDAGRVPLNPFNLWGYFLYELVDRNEVRRANNNIVRIVDEVWTFGPIANGVLAEIEYAMNLEKPIRFFSAGSKLSDISPIQPRQLDFEDDAAEQDKISQILDRISSYQHLKYGIDN